MEDSRFKLYSTGVVVEPKVLGSQEILVMPIEIIPFFDGEVKTSETSLIDKGVDKDGKPYAVEIASDISIKAEWLGLGESNRQTAPDVRRGERVLVYRYDQNDKFYWTSMGLDKGLRRLETVINRFSGHTDESVMILTDDNSYWYEISTHKGSITVNTSKMNKEKVRWGVKLDGMNGTLTAKDDMGNHLFIDSLEHLIELENTDKSRLRLDKKTALLETVESIRLHTKKITVDGDDSVTVNTKQHAVNADTSTFSLKKWIGKATTFAITAATTVKGKFAASGGAFTHEGTNVGATHKHKNTKPGSPAESSGTPQ